MVCVFVDVFYCLKICNYLIVIVILLYYYYITFSGESLEYVIGVERNNLLDFVKCYCFLKNVLKLFDYVCFILMFYLENDGEVVIYYLSCF